MLKYPVQVIRSMQGKISELNPLCAVALKLFDAPFTPVHHSSTCFLSEKIAEPQLHTHAM